MLSPKCSTLLALIAIIYASRDLFQIPDYTGGMMQTTEGSVASDLEKRQLATGFIQAESVFVRPGTNEVARHVVAFSIKDLARLGSFSTPAPSGIVHFTVFTLKFFQVILVRTLAFRVAY
jgi:hypothetical protein